MNGLPPGPRDGVLHQTVAFHRDPLAFLRAGQVEFGDVFTIRLLTARPVVVAAAPESVGELLEADPDSAHAGEARRSVLPFADPCSVFGGDGAAHRAAQAHVASALSPGAVDERREEMAAIAARHAEALPRGRPFPLLERVRDVTDEIFVRLVLGIDDEGLATRLVASIRHLLSTPGNPPVTLPGPGDGLVGRLGQKLFERRQAPALAALSEATGDRRRAEELMSLVMAAQEPPAIALTWLLDRLGRESDLTESFLAAPEGAEADSVVKETLRLQPPASAALRRLTAPRRVGGHELPAGVDVMVPSTLLHRDPRGFADPDDFRPGRWRETPAPDAPFFPFGGGARRCVGEHLAHAQIATVVPAFLAAGRIRPLAPEPELMVQRATVLVPKRGLLARVD
ncbi:MAG: Epi-isozizaene 5-monooxygenase/(E)-beta-farnesene synthase [Solirubrobacterales bacterium]|nr:Epi-isozizaene 5-monooxygenase/(E)-beta-farnesene synthase [Solirubrobacterales bacterium]